jgi:hypothetical protein
MILGVGYRSGGRSRLFGSYKREEPFDMFADGWWEYMRHVLGSCSVSDEVGGWSNYMYRQP